MTSKQRDPNLVFVGMPRKDDNLPACTRALWELVQTGRKLGRFTFMSANCTSFSSNKSRNILTALARDSEAGVMLQLDADMNAGEEQLLSVLERPEKIVGGLYPKKEITLKQSWVANFAQGSAMRPDGLWQCVDIGAGFLKTDMTVVDDMIARFPETAYYCEDAPWRNEIMHDLWSAGVVVDKWHADKDEYPRYLTDDFYFCWRGRKCGHQIWADTRAQCGHWGGVDFLQIVQLIQDLGAGTTPPSPAEVVSAMLPPSVR